MSDSELVKFKEYLKTYGRVGLEDETPEEAGFDLTWGYLRNCVIEQASILSIQLHAGATKGASYKEKIDCYASYFKALSKFDDTWEILADKIRKYMINTDQPITDNLDSPNGFLGAVFHFARTTHSDDKNINNFNVIAQPGYSPPDDIEDILSQLFTLSYVYNQPHAIFPAHVKLWIISSTAKLFTACSIFTFGGSIVGIYQSKTGPLNEEKVEDLKNLKETIVQLHETAIEESGEYRASSYRRRAPLMVKMLEAKTIYKSEGRVRNIFTDLKKAGRI